MRTYHNGELPWGHVDFRQRCRGTTRSNPLTNLTEGTSHPPDEPDLSGAKARNRSTNSGFMRRLASKYPLLLAQSPREENSLGVWKAAPELDIASIRIRIAGETAHGHIQRSRLTTVLA